MALSKIIAIGNGVTNTFAVSFALGYINESDITARVGNEVDGAGNPVYRAITFNTPELLTLAGAPPGNGVAVEFTRSTSRDTLLVDYEDGDIINAENLNTSQRQAIMLVHEVLDGRFANLNNDISLGGYRVRDVADPLLATDVANKRYVDDRLDTGATNAALAQAARVAAEAAAATATTQAGTATTARQLAETAASNAQGHSSTASNAAAQSGTARDAAQGYRNEAQTFRNQAEGFKNTAETAATDATNAITTVNTAKDVAVQAKNDAQSASTAAGTARNQAQTAQTGSETARDQAVVARGDAVGAATAALQYRDRANEWANKAEDVEVTPGQFSAYHWMKKAQSIAGGNIEQSQVNGLTTRLTAIETKNTNQDTDINTRLVKASNLSDLTNPATARTNLGGTTTGISLFTTSSVGTARAILNIVGQSICGSRLRRVSDTQIELYPVNGNHIFVNGLWRVLPSTTLKGSNAGVVAGNYYHWYVTESGGTLSLTRSGTGPQMITDATSGLQYMGLAGGNGTWVGMTGHLATNAVFQDNAQNRLIRSVYEEPPLVLQSTNIAGRQFDGDGATYQLILNGLQIWMLNFAGDQVRGTIHASVYNTTQGGLVKLNAAYNAATTGTAAAPVTLQQGFASVFTPMTCAVHVNGATQGINWLNISAAHAGTANFANLTHEHLITRAN